MPWELVKEFKFEAAHKLQHYSGLGHCERLHGHSWKGRVHLKFETLHIDGPQTGMGVDFAEIKRHLEGLIEKYLDHHYLNETLGMDSPTSENIAKWVFDYMSRSLGKNLEAVTIDETCTSSCTYRK